ncbi:MAG: membrane metalloprotease [Bacteroidota bacterium]
MIKLIKYAPVILLFIIASCSDKDPVTTNNVNNIVPANFLSSANYDKLIVEVQYVNGFQPSAAAVTNLTSFLQDRLNKTSGITVVQNAITSPGKSVYSTADVTAIENANRTQKPSGKTLTAYILFVDGDYSDNGTDTKVLGITYGSTSMVIFEKTVKEFSGGLSKPSTATLETTVTQHEFGHVLV